LSLFLSFAILSLGVGRLVRASSSIFSKSHRVLDVIFGVLGIILGCYVLASPLVGASMLIFLLALAALFYGIGSIAVGAVVGRLGKWRRVAFVVLGLIGVVFSFMVIVNPAIGILTLAWYLSISFMVHGVESIVSAIS
jgi:uncharacterized membrane protein HdeD (DUF308 family)